MNIKKQKKQSTAIKFAVFGDDREVGRVYLYLIENDLGKGYYGLVEDLFVEEKYRSKGLGGQLIQALIAEAKKLGCYKIIGTSRYSRPEVHEWYKRLGFKDYGKEFRIDF